MSSKEETKLTISDIQRLDVIDGDVVMIRGVFTELDTQILKENFKVIKEKRGIDFDVFLMKPDTEIDIVRKEARY